MGPDSCAACRELISADLDGETTDAERVTLADHLAGCAECTAFSSEAARLHRSLRVAAAAPIPDLTEAILAQAGAASGTEADAPVAVAGSTGSGHRRHGRRRRRSASPARRARVRVLAMQYGLLVVALLMVVLAVPELLASSGDAVHTSRHLGGWDVAFAVGLMLAALQPWRARGLLPMAFALAGVMAVTAGLDISRGSTAGLAESSHLLEVFGLAFLWLLARSVGGEDRPAQRRPESAPGDQAAAPGGIARLRVLPSRFGLVPSLATTPAPLALEATATGEADGVDDDHRHDRGDPGRRHATHPAARAA